MQRVVDRLAAADYGVASGLIVRFAAAAFRLVAQSVALVLTTLVIVQVTCPEVGNVSFALRRTGTFVSIRDELTALTPFINGFYEGLTMPLRGAYARAADLGRLTVGVLLGLDWTHPVTFGPLVLVALVVLSAVVFELIERDRAHRDALHLQSEALTAERGDVTPLDAGEGLQPLLKDASIPWSNRESATVNSLSLIKDGSPVSRLVCRIGYVTPSQEMLNLGLGFRLFDFLVTAGHVVQQLRGHQALVIVQGLNGPRCYRLNQLVEKIHLFRSVDICFLKFRPAAWSLLGMQALRLPTTLAGSRSVNVIQYYPSQWYTSSSFIRVSRNIAQEHDCTTLRGACGSPLLVGSTVYGMHLAGFSAKSKRNAALAAGAIKKCLEFIIKAHNYPYKISTRESPEDESETEWALQLMTVEEQKIERDENPEDEEEDAFEYEDDYEQAYQDPRDLEDSYRNDTDDDSDDFDADQANSSAVWTNDESAAPAKGKERLSDLARIDNKEAAAPKPVPVPSDPAPPTLPIGVQKIQSLYASSDGRAHPARAFDPPTKTFCPEAIAIVRKAYPAQEFAWPDRSTAAEARSFQVHANMQQAAYKRADHSLLGLVEGMVGQLDPFKRASQPRFVLEEFTRSRFDKICQAIIKTGGKTSPGYPYSCLGESKAVVIEKCSDLLFAWAGRRIELLKTHIDFPSRAWSFEDSELCDPGKTIVKGEPHSAAKVKEGRFRLVCAVSLVDLIVEHHLYDELLSWLHASVGSHPSMMGMTKEHHAALAVEAAKTNLIGNDISGMDISQFRAHFRLCVAGLIHWFNIDDALLLAMNNREYCAGWAPQYDSSGRRLLIEVPATPDAASKPVLTADGVRYDLHHNHKSGRLVTGLRNVILRLIADATAHAHVRNVFALYPGARDYGDDYVGKVPKEEWTAYEAGAARFGLVVKAWDKVFCGMRYAHGTYVNTAESSCKALSKFCLARGDGITASYDGNRVSFERHVSHLLLLDEVRAVLLSAGAGADKPEDVSD